MKEQPSLLYRLFTRQMATQDPGLSDRRFPLLMPAADVTRVQVVMKGATPGLRLDDFLQHLKNHRGKKNAKDLFPGKYEPVLIQYVRQKVLQRRVA